MANKRRKSRSLGNKLEDKILSTTTKVTVDKEGNAHAESIIEAVPVKGLAKMKRKSRESRGERKASPSLSLMSQIIRLNILRLLTMSATSNKNSLRVLHLVRISMMEPDAGIELSKWRPLQATVLL